MSAPQDAGNALSRREVLRLAGGAVGAAGLFAAARSMPPLSKGTRSNLPPLPSLGGVPTLPSQANSPTANTSLGEVVRFRTRPDLAFAAPTLSVDQPGQDSGLILMDTHGGPGGQGPIILDSSGQLVWFNPISANADPAKRAMNLQASEYRGKPVLTWFEGAVVNEHGEGHYVITDSSYSTVMTVEAGNGYVGDLHEFFLTPQGTAYFTAFGLGHGDLRPYGGSANGTYYYGVAQELDVATGKVLFQWRSDQHVSLAESYSTPAQYGKEPWDYFHINCISLDGAGDLLISSRNTWTIYKVSRATGQVIWRMGGKRSDFSFAPGAAYAWQHDTLAQPGGIITVFDNGAGNAVTQKQSRGLVLRPDYSNKTVELVRQYLHPGGALVAKALGSVQLLPNGHAFMGWGNWASFSEFGPSGQALLNGRLAGNTTLSYRAFRSAWAGFPTEPPAVAVAPAGSATTVWVSWNGATDVARWVVLGGADSTHLPALGVAPKAGFETQISVPSRPAYVAVAALDAGGHEIGRSTTVKA